MRIATYNIWNHTKTNQLRFPQLITEIQAADADVIGLQEVTPQFHRDAAAILSQYPYHIFSQYTGEEEGLSLFSRYPILSQTFLHTEPAYKSDALHCILSCGSLKISVANVHLPWDSAKEREQQIVAIQRFLNTQPAEYHFLLGDFNCSLRSSIHGFLIGDCTVNGEEAKPVWLDVAGNYATLQGAKQSPTLDPVTNPRWKGENTTHLPEIYDRIYIRDNRKAFAFRYVNIFGSKMSAETGFCASDHYGVLTDVDLQETT